MSILQDKIESIGSANGSSCRVDLANTFTKRVKSALRKRLRLVIPLPLQLKQVQPNQIVNIFQGFIFQIVFKVIF